MKTLMKTNSIVPTALLLAAVTVSGSAFAHNDNHCSMDLHNGVTISPDQVKVFDDNKTLFQIQQNGALSVNGQPVALTVEQQQISAQYAEGLRKVVPDAVDVALEAIDVASTGVNTALTALFGENSDIENKVNGIIDKARDKIDQSMDRNGQQYTIAPHSFDDLENTFGKEFEEEIEEVAMSSMGSVFSLLSDAMSSGTGTFEQRMEAFGKKMEAMSEDLEQTLQAQSEVLKDKAESLCYQLKDIDKLETELQQSVPQFAAYDLLDMDEEAE